MPIKINLGEIKSKDTLFARLKVLKFITLDSIVLDRWTNCLVTN